MTTATPVEQPVVISERFGRVFVITLNRPHARNAVDAALAAGLETALDELESDPDLWVGVLTGAGPVFCAGADLKQVAAGGLNSLITPRGGFAGLVEKERTKPLIAALQGDAIAGGLEIAIACDVILAAEGARAGIPEVSRSLIAVGGALACLPALIGEKAALLLAMSGALWPVERFAELGLVSEVTAPGAVVDRARLLAEQICANAPLAVRLSRRAITGGRDRSLPERMRWGMELLEELSATEDFAEGPRAFVEKRPAVWVGR